ncbi:unnamed protein product [Brassica oleracea var. botrytis]
MFSYFFISYLFSISSLFRFFSLTSTHFLQLPKFVSFSTPSPVKLFLPLHH